MLEVYKINDYEYWATRKGFQDIKTIWELETGETYEEDSPYPEKCNIEVDGCWDSIDGPIEDSRLTPHSVLNPKKGDIKRVYEDTFYIFKSFEELINEYYPEFVDAFCIASSEI